MKAAALLLVAVVVLIQSNLANADRGDDHEVLRAWQNFLRQRHQSGFLPYADATETNRRYEIFVHNYRYISQHNRKGENFHMAVNKFADLTREEWKLLASGESIKPHHVNKTKPPHPHHGANFGAESLCTHKPPASHSWNAVTAPMDQGQYGGVGMIATIESIIDANMIKNGQAISPSRQELIDCVGSADFPVEFFQWIVQQGGIDSESSYPYTNYPGTCQPTKQYAAELSGYVEVESGNETELACAVAFNEPVTVCVDSSLASFQFYSGGIYYEPACASNAPDHCMIVTGYGTLGTGKNYWIVENSWGTDWGLNGYIWMAKDRKNNCGIATYASFPILK